MKLEQLLTFEAIVATGTFHKAAERLNKSQSAVSNAIRLLEEELDLTLISREAYRPKLTPEGEIFFREASRVLAQTRELAATAARLRAREEPELSIAITATLSLDRLLPLLDEIDRRHPATQIRLLTEVMGGPISRLMEQRVDIAIATLEGVPLDEVETQRFAEVTIRPVASPRLVKRLAPGAKSMAAMQTFPQIVVSGTDGPDHKQSRDLLPGGRKWTVSDFSAKKQVILSGQGWGGLPDHLMREELDTGALEPLVVEGFPPRHSEIFAMRRRDQAPGPVASNLWDLLIAAGNESLDAEDDV